MFRARLFRLAAAAAGAGGRRCALRAVPGPRCSERAKVQCSCSVQCAEWAAAVRRPGRDVRARARPRSAGAVVWPQGGLLSTHTRTHRTPTALNGTSTLGYFGVLTVLSSLCDTHTPQTRDRTSLALMLLSVLAQHAWSMGSG